MYIVPRPGSFKGPRRMTVRTIRLVYLLLLSSSFTLQ